MARIKGKGEDSSGVRGCRRVNVDGGVGKWQGKGPRERMSGSGRASGRDRHSGKDTPSGREIAVGG